MSILGPRACGVCEVADIPRGVDWPYWAKGRPVHPACIALKVPEVVDGRRVAPCWSCVHRLELPGSAHSRCNNVEAKVMGAERGIEMGWFRWPLNFDPTWLEGCTGWSNNPEDAKPRVEHDGLTELLGLLPSSRFRARP